MLGNRLQTTMNVQYLSGPVFRGDRGPLGVYLGQLRLQDLVFSVNGRHKEHFSLDEIYASTDVKMIWESDFTQIDKYRFGAKFHPDQDHTNWGMSSSQAISQAFRSYIQEVDDITDYSDFLVNLKSCVLYLIRTLHGTEWYSNLGGFDSSFDGEISKRGLNHAMVQQSRQGLEFDTANLDLRYNCALANLDHDELLSDLAPIKLQSVRTNLELFPITTYDGEIYRPGYIDCDCSICSNSLDTVLMHDETELYLTKTREFVYDNYSEYNGYITPDMEFLANVTLWATSFSQVKMHRTILESTCYVSKLDNVEMIRLGSGYAIMSHIQMSREHPHIKVLSLSTIEETMLVSVCLVIKSVNSIFNHSSVKGYDPVDYVGTVFVPSCLTRIPVLYDSEGYGYWIYDDEYVNVAKTYSPFIGALAALAKDIPISFDLWGVRNGRQTTTTCLLEGSWELLPSILRENGTKPITCIKRSQFQYFVGGEMRPFTGRDFYFFNSSVSVFNMLTNIWFITSSKIMFDDRDNVKKNEVKRHNRNNFPIVRKNLRRKGRNRRRM
jgi:hypothetical protein